MRELNWDPITNDKLWPRLMAALRQVMADNYETDPEIDRASALDALDVPYELDEKGEPQIDPVGTWPISALREIASQSGKSIDYLLGDTDATANPRHAEEITKHMDAAMAKLQLLTELFGTDANLSMCNEGLRYIVDGMAHDLGSIYEIIDGRGSIA